MGGSLVTLGKVMTEAGYQMVYKGKWHLDESFAISSSKRPVDLDRLMIEDDAMENHYDLPGWTSPDLGTGESAISKMKQRRKPDSALNTLGGGNVENDNRIVHGPMYSPRQECATEFLKNYDPNSEKPFCLVVSLANPHDIWVYPYSTDTAGYKGKEWLTEAYDSIKLPHSYFSSLATKPDAQSDFLNGFQGGPLDDDDAREYGDCSMMFMFEIWRGAIMFIAVLLVLFRAEGFR